MKGNLKQNEVVSDGLRYELSFNSIIDVKNRDLKDGDEVEFHLKEIKQDRFTLIIAELN